MLKLAVIGAQTLLGRELVQVLEQRDCSVLPLATGTLSKADEEGDVVVFAPDPALLEGLDVAVLVDTPENPALLDAFQGRILDLRAEPQPGAESLPLLGRWPAEVKVLKGRPAVELVLATLPTLISGVGEVGGTHLCSVAALGDLGLDGLMEQTVSILQGEEPKLDKLNYRAAFEIVPQVPRGSLIEVRVPAFHGDLLILHLRAAEGQTLARKEEAPAGIQWVQTPPTNREVAVSSDLLAHLSLGAEGRTGILSLGFDPTLWGVLRPLMRLLEL